MDELRRFARTSAALRKLAAIEIGGWEPTRPPKPSLVSRAAGAAGAAGRAVGKAAYPFRHPLKAAGRAATGVATTALQHPAKAAVLGLSGVAAAGAAKKTMAQFHPAVHRAQLGMQP